MIASGLTSNITSYKWQIPASLATAHARIKVTAEDLIGNEGQMQTAGDFAIMQTGFPSGTIEINYEYDKLNRLSKSNSSAVPSLTYAYDALGNRLNLAVSGVTPPAAPTNLTAASISSSQINLAWQDKSNNEEGFKIERSLNQTSGFIQAASVGANITSFNNTGLNADTIYFYKVKAYNSGGDSAYTNIANATTAQVPPAAPTNLTATTVTSTQINLAWIDKANNEAGFKIERAVAGANYTQIGTVAANITVYNNTGLNANTTYDYKVRAYNNAGNSTYSNTASASTAQVFPQAPSNLQATAVSSSQINLNWQDNSNNEAGFKIERSLSSSSGFSQIASVSNISSYSNTGLNASTTYYYKVLAYNGGGNSAYSNLANATTSSVANSPPKADSVSPINSSSSVNSAVDFTTAYSDPDGYANIDYVLFLLTDGSKLVYGYYQQSTNKLYLRNDNDTAWLGGYTPGSANTIENSYGKLDCSKTTVSGSGNNLMVKWNISFKPAFAQTSSVYMYVTDKAKANSGFVVKGTWGLST
ncbi:MAG: fibronectin type III domain-containing protein [Candidatus Omnitrophica bacterium]|nr:fibronectin type III domain-containing protein [Candidatus Omnitrophota bacterium]